MYKDTRYCVVTLSAAVILLVASVEAVPAKRSSRMIREVYPEIEPESEGSQAQVCIVGDVVYGNDETVPADQPCLKCKCQPPGVQCETIQCAKRPGCKAIHKPNRCCPDYQCECEHNGRIHANGEKLETPPGGECKVCYCRGGEVQCAEVSCYIRTDCEGKRVPGTCCPRYDHCPPIDPVPNRPVYTTDIIISNSNKDQFEPWPITSTQSNSTESVQGTDYQEENNKIPDTNSYDSTTASSSYQPAEQTDLQRDASASVLIPRITIQEIIPERKEIPVTAPPKSEIEPQGTLIIEEAEEFLNNSNDLGIPDTDAESSEISETFQHPPPVLKVGDKLLFLKKGEFVHEKYATEPSSVITVIGAEGLQRGGIEDSVEVHEIKTDPEPETAANVTEVEKEFEEEDLADILSLNTAASTHILSLLKRKNKPSPLTSTTEAPSSEVTSPEPVPTEDVSSNMTDVSSTSASSYETSIANESIESPTTVSLSEVTTTEVSKIEPASTSAIPKHVDVTEQNPAYPPIPDIMSPNMDDVSQRFELENAENTTGNIEIKILPEVLEIRSNKTLPANSTHGEWLKTVLNPNATLPEDLLKQKAPIDGEETTTEAGVTTSKEASETTTIVDSMIGNLTVEELHKSMEIMEDSAEGSKEVTTKKNSHALLVSEEDASVEGKEPSGEANDMVEESDKTEDADTEKATMRDLIDSVNEDKKNHTEAQPIDVEFIDFSRLPKQKPTIERTMSSTEMPELLPKPEKLEEVPLRIIKRESSMEDEDTSEEDQTEKVAGSDEDEKEADAIFRELLEDTSTSKPSSPENREIATLSRVSNALEQFSRRGGSPDTNILGILSNFFRSQYQE